MKKIIITLTGLACFIFSGLVLAQLIREPVVSGTFYPDSAKILAERIKQFLDWAEVEKKDQDILAIIAPHAGYDYSGSVAGYAYKLIKGQPVKTVILIGSSHFESFDGVSVYPHGAWQTPLGNVDIDTELAQALIEQHPKISFFEPAFSREHSLEVQLPFLQMVLDDFQIVPILMGRLNYENCQILNQALIKLLAGKEQVLIVASTDMSHYHNQARASEIDKLTTTEIKNFNPQSLYQKIVSRECELCGSAAVLTTMLYAQSLGIDQVEILKYANSGDITGDSQKVVGYLSAVIYAGPRREKMSEQAKDLLDEQQKARLLKIARQTIEKFVTEAERLDVQEDDPLLLKNMGAFVTIHQQGRLRGCIGNIIGQQPLYLTVRDMAIEAASADPRFDPVTVEELTKIDIEVSVLTEPERVEDVEQIEMGKHGVIVKKGFASGVFLPQVATETGWGREEFLSNLCAHKAGLSPQAWQDGSAELYSFAAQVFGEK
ncbi:AmmeMemoRadiSam system protein B [Candidatus Omnitrophota bacterium]